MKHGWKLFCPVSATAPSSAPLSTGAACRRSQRPPQSSGSSRSISSSGRRRTPAWAASTGPSTSCCRCSSAAPLPTSTMSNWANAAVGGQTSGPIPEPHRSVQTPVVASETTRPSSRPPCLEDALRDLTSRGDIVVDPFLGSGSTLIAAEATGRVCRGVELDPLYVDVIIRRYQAASFARRECFTPA